MDSAQPQRALLFMPDISGFTQFVSETEILHSQHVIRELLEILIDCNRLNLQVSEVEGNAIFFYRPGNKPDVQSLLQQAEEMFTRFHAYLKLYERQRICPCGACKTAVDLSLKIIVHYGEVTGIAVKQHKKLFGKDVILLHRLLKNNLDKKEYVLLTEALTEEMEANDLPAWYVPQKAVEQYDVGKVRFYFSDLSDLRKTVNINVPVYNSSSRTFVAFTEEEVIPGSMESVSHTLLRMEEQINPLEKEKRNDTPIKIGEKHPCIITRNNARNVTESVKMEAENIEMVEMNENGIAGYRYLLRKLSPVETRLSIEMLIRNHPLFRIGFLLGIKSKMLKRIKRFFVNLKDNLEKTRLSGLSA